MGSTIPESETFFGAQGRTGFDLVIVSNSMKNIGTRDFNRGHDAIILTLLGQQTPRCFVSDWNQNLSANSV
jgi:hypothetical protein